MVGTSGTGSFFHMGKASINKLACNYTFFLDGRPALFALECSPAPGHGPPTRAVAALDLAPPARPSAGQGVPLVESARLVRNHQLEPGPLTEPPEHALP
jgi:hypothetical protein